MGEKTVKKINTHAGRGGKRTKALGDFDENRNHVWRPATRREVIDSDGGGDGDDGRIQRHARINGDDGQHCGGSETHR